MPRWKSGREITLQEENSEHFLDHCLTKQQQQKTQNNPAPNQKISTTKRTESTKESPTSGLVW